MLKRLQHRGISVSHGCFDRAVLSSLARKSEQLHAVYFDEDLGFGGDDSHLMFLTNWQIHTGCCLHDVQNALKWSLMPFSSKDILSDTHIVIESLRNYFTLLCSHVCRFLRTRLTYSADQYEPERVCEFWRLMRTPEEFIGEFVQANLRWDKGRLLTSMPLNGYLVMERVSFVCMVVFKFRPFKAARWCASGPSCAALVASLSIGLPELVNITRQDSTCTDYDLHGVTKLSLEVELFVVVNAVSSFFQNHCWLSE